MKYEQNLAFLKETFEGRVYLTLEEFAQVYCVTKKTVSNWLHRGRCPVAPKRINGRPLWLITDIARATSEEGA